MAGFAVSINGWIWVSTEAHAANSSDAADTATVGAEGGVTSLPLRLEVAPAIGAVRTPCRPHLLLDDPSAFGETKAYR
jgi:hypothetical protein